MNFIITNTQFEKDNLNSLSQSLLFKEFKGFYACFDSQVSVCNSANEYTAFIQGYLNDFSFNKLDINEQNESAISKILEQWPASSEVSGSFGLTIIQKNKIIICNDVIGFYPIYYFIDKGNIVITSSLIWASAIIDTTFDSIGITQRTIGKEYSNIGSRTIIKGFKRLLPGESICFNTISFEIKKSYDNTLYSAVGEAKKTKKNTFKQFWEIYKREVDYAISKKPKASIALSGGMDSRILLGAISEEKKVACLTYGNAASYEVKIAKRLAKIKNFSFKNYENLDFYFPSKPKIKNYVIETEAIYVSSWLEILENVSKDKNTQFLLGDMCEALPARNIKVYSGRDTRIKNFIKTNIFNKAFKFTEASNSKFQNWKKNKSNEVLKRYSLERYKTLNLQIKYNELVEGVRINLEELFSRIEAHNLPYVELYDELYAWYTHSRIPMGKQILICNSKYRSICPPMALSILRAASNIHPNNRLNYRFMHGVFKNNSDLKVLHKIPSNQAPLFPQNFYAPLLFLVWGARSKLDQYLIKRILKKKNSKLRYRLFKGLNWVSIYQNESLEKRMTSYFNPNHLGNNVYQNITKTIISRKKLEKWPLTNTDLMSLASLNVELDIIKQYNAEF